LFKYDVTGASITEAFATLSVPATSMANGFVHASDGCAYFAYNNRICRIDASGNFTDSILTLQETNLQVLSLAPYGEYVAIAASPITGVGKSYALLWDRDSSVNNITTKINWGEGKLKVLDNINGALIGISDVLTDNSFGASNASIIIKTYTGADPEVIKEIKLNASASSSVPALTQSKQVKDSKLFFFGTIPTDRGTITGIHCVGRKLTTMPLAISTVVAEKNLAANKSINGFISVGNFWWMSYNTDGSVSKTIDPAGTLASLYTTTSECVTQIFKEMSSSELKKLIGITVEFLPLPVNGSVKLSYRKDADSAWTDIFTYLGSGTHTEFGTTGVSNTGTTSHSAINIESTGGNLPVYKEIQFRIQSTGNAEILGYNFETEAVPGAKPY
jgi:hypothetical protein